MVGKQLLIRKNERVLSKKTERSGFAVPPSPPPLSPTTQNHLNLSVDHSHAPAVAFGAISKDQKFVFPVEKKAIFNTVAPSKEISLPGCELDVNWKYSENCNELISVRGRFEQNKKFGKMS